MKDIKYTFVLFTFVLRLKGQCLLFALSVKNGLYILPDFMYQPKTFNGDKR